MVIWLRVYPTSPVRGFLFGVWQQTVPRTIAQVLPINLVGDGLRDLLDPYSRTNI
jgi:hypothetical protein